jgi:hypothetical protein
MKKANIQIVLFVVLIAASIAAQIFIGHKEHIQQANNQKLVHFSEKDSVKAPVSFDVEILKILLEHGKNHLPIILNSPSSID